MTIQNPTVTITLQNSFIFRAMFGFIVLLTFLSIFLYMQLMELGETQQFDRLGGFLHQRKRSSIGKYYWKNLRQKYKQQTKTHKKSLREEFDGSSSGSSSSSNTVEEFLNDQQSLKSSIALLRFPQVPTHSSIPYDIHDCPFSPPKNYPFAWNIMSVLGNWNPKETGLPLSSPEADDQPSHHYIYQGLCIFDWTIDRDKARNYREHDLPFVLQNHPQVIEATERWTTPGYLERLLSNKRETLLHQNSYDSDRTTTARTTMTTKTLQEQNSNIGSSNLTFWTFLFPILSWKMTEDTDGWKYAQWLDVADDVEEMDSSSSSNTAMMMQIEDEEHQEENGDYVLDSFSDHFYLYDELPFFDPNVRDDDIAVDEHGEGEEEKEESFFISQFLAEPHNSNIQCRFGMRGNIVETHFEKHSSFVALMGGQQRYILSHPDQCHHMEMYPSEDGDPTVHSNVDWTTIYDTLPESWDRPIAKTLVNEVILQAGDLLYLPTYWFRYTVSLNTNYQCSAASNISFDNEEHIIDCGLEDDDAVLEE